MSRVSRGHNSATALRLLAWETDLHFERLSLQSLEEGLVGFRHKSHRLVARAVIGLEHVAEAHILEALALPDVVVVLRRDFFESGPKREQDTKREQGAQRELLHVRGC